MPKYRIVRGTYNPRDGERAEPGDVIELSEDRAARLPNESIEPVVEESEDPVEDPVEESLTESAEVEEELDEDDVAADTSEDDDELAAEISESLSEDVTPEDSDDDTQVVSAIPDDYRLLSKMASSHDSPHVHGAMKQVEIEEFFEDEDPELVLELLNEARSE